MSGATFIMVLGLWFWDHGQWDGIKQWPLANKRLETERWRRPWKRAMNVNTVAFNPLHPQTIGILSNGNYFLSSVPVCNYFAIMPDSLRQMRFAHAGDRPRESCRSQLPQSFELQSDGARPHWVLRSLQNPFVKFQSGRPELWIEAAEQTRNWLDDDRNPGFFEELDAEEWSPRDSRDEGEEEEEATDDDPSQPGDHGEDDSRDDGGDRFDYDEDEPGDGGCGGHRERVAVVRSKPSAAPRAGWVKGHSTDAPNRKTRRVANNPAVQ